ncbi:MAG: HAD family hydrolase [Gemmataceae bacterium]
MKFLQTASQLARCSVSPAYHPIMIVLLFDIDGTLVRTGGAGKAAMEAALVRHFGVRTIRDVVRYSGRTDVAIAADLLAAHDLPVSVSEGERLTERYLDELPAALAAHPGNICPGLLPLLAKLHQNPAVSLGLLTGNIRRGARIKLEHFDLWNRFAYGGFGDRHTDRDDVARAALVAAEDHHGHRIDPRLVWVIGDTPLDVSCARAIGAKVVAVATGYHPLDELQSTGADLVLPDLSNPADWPTEWFDPHWA